MSGKVFVEAVESMGAAPTRKGLEDWLMGLKNYTHDGLQTPFDYVPQTTTQPTDEDCFTVAQWQDAKGGWVQTRRLRPRATPTPRCTPPTPPRTARSALREVERGVGGDGGAQLGSARRRSDLALGQHVADVGERSA